MRDDRARARHRARAPGDPSRRSRRRGARARRRRTRRRGRRSPSSDDGALGAADVSVAMSAAGAAPGEWAVALASDDVRDAALALTVPRACRANRVRSRRCARRRPRRRPPALARGRLRQSRPPGRSLPGALGGRSLDGRRRVSIRPGIRPTSRCAVSPLRQASPYLPDPHATPRRSYPRRAQSLESSGRVSVSTAARYPSMELRSGVVRGDGRECAWPTW